MAVLAVGAALEWTFLPPTESAADDGFQMQLLYVVTQWEEGLLFHEHQDWLLWVHVGRLLAVGGFMLADVQIGSPASLALLLLLLWPLVSYACNVAPPWLAAAPLLLPLAVSGRSVLVAAGVGYVALFLLRPVARPRLLWIGAFLANLSSASVMTCALLLVFVRNPAGQRGGRTLHRGLVLAMLLVSLGVSATDKLAGFQSGAAGYEAHAFVADNLLLATLSRATLLVSLAEGQYLRAIAYLTVAGYLVLQLLRRLRSRHAVFAKRMLLCCLPGVLMEGLGVLALFFPVFWLFVGALTQAQGVGRPVSRSPRAARVGSVA